MLSIIKLICFTALSITQVFGVQVVNEHVKPSTCPEGWYEERADPVKCLKIVTEARSWTDAWTDCLVAGNDSTLLHISNVFENLEILNNIANHCSQFYTGLFRNVYDEWIWTTGDTITYAHWKAGYPTNDTTQNCVSFDGNTGMWYNMDCDKLQCYACQQYF
uniref:C-type lectin domain-containing protein n=1 Tax=Acrobeloides nanus TaxID=290746 RepID=A0A914CFM4_9BILA